MENIIRNDRAGFAYIQLNRPKKLNVLNEQLVVELKSALEDCSQSDEIRGVILTGAGKGFCAGGDVVSVIEGIKDGREYDFFFKKEYELDLMIHHFAKPILVAGHGPVMGGGMGLLSGASERVLRADSLVAMPEVSIGFFADVGANKFLSHLPRFWRLFLCLTGARLSAKLASELELCDVVVSQSQWVEYLKDLTNDRFEKIGQKFNCAQAMIGERDFLEQKIKPIENFESLKQFDEWADKEISSAPNSYLGKSLSSYKRGSLISSALSWCLFGQERDIEIKQAFELDLACAKVCSRFDDFAQGVKALLITKDKNPQWQFKSVDELPQELWDEISQSLKLDQVPAD